MTNKTLAWIGIIVWILSVLSSAEDLNGNPTAPKVLIVLSSFLLLFFVIFASKRLWKEKKAVSVLFVSSFVIKTFFEVLISVNLVTNGSLIILVYSLSKIIYIISLILTLKYLFKLKSYA